MILNNLDECFKLQDGFPRPIWEQLHERVTAHHSSTCTAEVLTEVACLWLEKLKVHLGTPYEVYEDDAFLFLAPVDVERATLLLETAGMARQFITRTFTDLAKNPTDGKIVLLSFSDSQLYYEYISHFDEDGDYAGSGGMFIPDWYSHIVLNTIDRDQIQWTIVHELSHALLHHCNMPQWLDEGISQLTEQAVIPSARFTLSRDDLKHHQRFWKKNGIQDFWEGITFSRPGDSQPLSYTLSQILVRNMLSNDQTHFLEFVRLAKKNDHGEEASRTVFGRTLGDWAEQFLGRGDWEITISGADALCDRARFRQRQGACQKAVRDCRYANAQYPDEPRPYRELAWILSTCLDDDIRDGIEAVPLAIRACELTNWRDTASLDVLAAAYARQGNFEEAIRWEQKAIALADPTKKTVLEARLQSYKKGMPYIDYS